MVAGSRWLRRRSGEARRLLSAHAPLIVDWDKIEAERGSGYPTWLREELRSDHAGETGACYIYRGALGAMELRSYSSKKLSSVLGIQTFCPYHSLTTQKAYTFSKRHLETEEAHLKLMEKLVPPSERSKLLPMWKLAGFTLGILPVLASPTSTRAFFATIAAVETFVEKHYVGHIEPLEMDGSKPELVRLLRFVLLRIPLVAKLSFDFSSRVSMAPFFRHCCDEEVGHKDEASEAADSEGECGPITTAAIGAWSVVVEGGSELAVLFAKKI